MGTLIVEGINASFSIDVAAPGGIVTWKFSAYTG